MWMSLTVTALASPAERLEQAAQGLESDPMFTGVLHHQGHGATPGAVRDLPFRARVDTTEHGAFAIWEGAGWSERLWLSGRAVSEGEPWETAARPERAVLQALAPRPDLLLRWLAQRPEQLREVDEGIVWGFSGGLATLTFEGDRPVRLAWTEAHPVFGDVENHIVWRPGSIELAFTEADTRWTASFSPATSAPEAPSPPARVHVVPLDEGAWMLEVPEADSRVVLVTAGTQGALLDAPLSTELGEALWAEAARLAPQVTDWLVVVSHHHPHYTGGLRPWVRHGARLLVHDDLASWLRPELERDRTGDPGVRAVIDLVRPGDTLHLLDGHLWVMAIDDASGHTDAFLVSFLQDSRTLYVADLARQPSEGPAKHRGTWPALVQRWQVNRVVSGFPLGDAAVFPFAALQ